MAATEEFVTDADSQLEVKTQEQIQEIIDSGITHQSSEMSYHQIAIGDLEYPNEAYYKEQAGK